jgi:hypothetical protein
MRQRRKIISAEQFDKLLGFGAYSQASDPNDMEEGDGD